MSKEHLISDYKTRKQKNNEYILQVLNFLKEETYSDMRILMLSTGIKDRQQFYRLCKKMSDAGLIIKYVFKSLFGDLALWGITRPGLAVVLKPDDETVPPWFEPSKLRGWGLEHHLFNQRIRLELEHQGATGWLNGDRAIFRHRYPGVKHRPDGVITLANGITVAIEGERHPKTPARYGQIMAGHLLARSAEHWKFVLYVTPDDQTKLILEKYFAAIKTLSVNARKIDVEPKFRRVFLFCTLDELRNTPVTGMIKSPSVQTA
ncbi:molybdopterin-guanine dinucleotide biosynthesis protein MobC [Dickeya oryzae]|uniref:MobC family replication-relaxation protein n=1 Tax=Dickeya oryzae TaxID=1240404 RepID=UPI001AEC954A|nr:MobC family replication-relaxation protein [Dickeya oryzae]MBP2845799.1 molybdopterin-guanine dinucleotide biosynthesis protein MobC [Dickeya oryzae]